MEPNGIIKKHIAPCGLHCGGCFAFNGGNIQRHSTELAKSLGDFDVYAQRFVTMLDEPVFENYQSFKMIAVIISRKPNATAAANRHVPCSKVAMSGIVSVRRVSIFCFQCTSFPCEQTGFDEHLQKRFISINEKIRKIGIENYYEEIKDVPRY